MGQKLKKTHQTLEPEKLNLSGALALFCPTFEELEELKQSLITNMQHSISEAKRIRPIYGTQEEYDAWFREEFEVGRKWIDDAQFVSIMIVNGNLQKLMIEQSTTEPRRVLKRIVQRQQHMLTPLKRQGGVTDEQIEQAREYPPEDMIDTRIFKAGGKWRSNCHCPLPDHAGERTPSFYIDKKGRWKCFGCQTSGDSIGLFALLNGLDLKKDFVKIVKGLIN